MSSPCEARYQLARERTLDERSLIDQSNLRSVDRAEYTFSGANRAE